MFDDMFDNMFDDENLESQFILNSYERLPRNCAHNLPIPQTQRLPSTPIGLKNQGCTCYLNSLLQILFFTPQFRNVIYKIPLFKQTLQQPTEYLDKESKTKFVLGFQQLFSQMQLSTCRSVGTSNLNEAFGWNQNQQAEQHDINESMVVIFETLQRALVSTQFEGAIKQSFKIVTRKQIQCLSCHTVRNKTPEQVFQLLVYTQNNNTLKQCIHSLLQPEILQGLDCENEGSKQNAKLALTIQQIPQVLIITMARFDFDYNTFQRVKVNSTITFDLELNIGQHLKQATDKIYELYGVLIHSGSAHGGHYFAYIRDVMQESNWDDSRKQTQVQDNKEKEKRKKETQTQTQKPKTDEKKKAQEQKQQQNYQLKEPTNNALKNNWYQLNDSIVKPIQAAKIATQFGGTQCAYILFYRAINETPITKVEPPVYLRQSIQKKNLQFKQKRDLYQVELNHINLTINQTLYKFNINDSIGSLLQKHCPKGSNLVNKQQKNDLPYYPRVLNHQNINLSDTIIKTDLIHESKWIVLSSQSSEFKDIKDLIGIEKVPISLTILHNSQVTSIISYLDKTFLELRIELQTKFNVPYEKQIIKLSSNLGKDVFLTDDLANDESILSKLKFQHFSQIVLDHLKTQGQQVVIQQVKQVKDILPFAIQRDDASGMRRYYANATMTLEQAFDYFKKAQNITDGYKRRLRWTNRNRLFSIDQYPKLLSQFPFQQSIVKLKIERGQIPIKGDICVNVKMQSKHQGDSTPSIYETIQDPNITLKHLKQQICNHFSLNPADHKLYRTDWLGEPTRPITKQIQTLFEANFSLQQLIVLRDLDSKVASQMIHLNVNISLTGFPDDCQKGFTFTTQQTKTLQQIKQELLKVTQVKQILGQNPSYKRLRIRQLKRDYMFGSVFRQHTKTLKGNGLENYKIVIQPLSFQQDLSQDDFVLILKYRDSANRLYLDQKQFIFRASKVPTLKELKQAILFSKQLELPEDQLRVFKYYLHDLQWVQWSDSSYKKWLQMKEKGNKHKQIQKAKQKQTNKNKNKNNEDKKNNKIQNVQNLNKNIRQTESTVKQTTNNSLQTTRQQQILSNNKQQNPKTEKTQGQQKQGKKKQNKQQTQKKAIEIQNLRKMPFLLKDGDMLGYGFNSQMLPNDDLQTEQDENLRLLQDNERKKTKGKKHVKQNPFAFNGLDF